MTRNEQAQFRRDIGKQVAYINSRSKSPLARRKFMKKVTLAMNLMGLGDPDDWHVRIYPTFRLQHWSGAEVDGPTWESIKPEHRAEVERALRRWCDHRTIAEQEQLRKEVRRVHTAVDILCDERSSRRLRRAAFTILRAWDGRMRESGGLLWQYKETWKVTSHRDLRLIREGTERMRLARARKKAA